jgi:hypothetical protein
MKSNNKRIMKSLLVDAEAVNSEACKARCMYCNNFTD